MPMKTVRFISILLAAFLLYAAYKTPEDPWPFVMAGAFFGLMAYWSFRNKGAVDGSFLYFAVATSAFFFTFQGLIVPRHAQKFLLKENPAGFWTIFTIYFLFGLASLTYGIYKLKKQKHA